MAASRELMVTLEAGAGSAVVEEKKMAFTCTRSGEDRVTGLQRLQGEKGVYRSHIVLSQRVRQPALPHLCQSLVNKKPEKTIIRAAVHETVECGVTARNSETGVGEGGELCGWFLWLCG